MSGNRNSPETGLVSHQFGAAVSMSFANSFTEFERLRLLVDGLDAGFGLLAPDYTILELNDEAMRIDGRSRDAVIGQTHWIAYPGTEHSEVGKLYKAVMSSREAASVKHTYHWDDGRISGYETRAFPVTGGCIGVYFRDISEQHHAEQQSLRSEQRFKAAVAAVDGVVWTNNAKGEMIGLQPAWSELTGQTFEQYQGSGWADAVHPDDAQPTIDAWQIAVDTKQPFTFEHRVRHRDGKWRLFAIRAVPVLDDDGGIREWVGIHRDVTEQRASELRLRQVAEMVDAVFYVYQFETGQTFYVSPAFEKIWRQPPSAAYNNPRQFMQAIHPDDRDRIRAETEALRNGESRTLEFRLLFPGDDERIIRDQTSMMIDTETGARILVGFATDITDFRRAQDQLARNAETFSNLVTTNPFGIYVIDADFKLSEVSLGAVKAFANIDPLIGRDFAEIMQIIWAEPFASEAIGRFRHTLETGEPYVSKETVEQRADTAEIESYDWRIERIIMPDGRYGVVCYFYDLSERASYEQQLKALIADKELLAREIDHRVKNSLTIVGALLSMQLGATKNDETRAALTEAKSRVIAVARVHEQLHKSHQVGIVAFADYLRQLCHDLEYSLRRSGVELDFAADPVDLPAEQAMTLAIVVNELVTNAYKHGGAAGAKKIAVQLKLHRKELHLTVADDGAGLPGSFVAKSAGLGFRLIENLSKQLGAKLTMPRPGGPAEFSLILPYDPAPSLMD